MMEMLTLSRLMTTIRSRLGLSPDVEAGTKRQKRGDVVFRAWPVSAEDLPMGHIMSLVLTAMRRSLVHLPDSLLEAWAGFRGMLARPDGLPCFIEDLVVLSRDRPPATSALRNTRLVATGGLHQVTPRQRLRRGGALWSCVLIRACGDGQAGSDDLEVGARDLSMS
jgi:hypothetical protein